MRFNFEDIRRLFQKEFQVELEFKGLDDDVVVTIAKLLLPHVARKMGKEENDVKRCLTKIGMTEGPEINGYVDSPDDWKTFQIYASNSLMIFLHKMVKLSVSRMGVLGSDNRIVERTKISNETMISTSRRLMDSFWKDTLLQTEGFGIMELTKSQIEFAAYLLHYAECFVVAHEFGHAIIEICPERIGEELFTAFTDAVSRSKPLLESLELDNEEKNEILQYWPKEMTADLLGLQLCLKLRDDDAGRIMIFSSVEWVLIMMNMIEKFYEKTYRQYLYTVSHPPTELRLEFLHSVVEKSNPSNALQLGIAFRQWSDYILSRV